MSHIQSRREFLAGSATIGAGLGLGLGPGAARGCAAEPTFKTKLVKSLILEKPNEDALKKIKDAGFDGVEGGVVGPQEAERCRGIAEKIGIKIHSVIRGWAEFNSPDKSKVDATFAVTENALRTAQGYGADAVLLVPCRIGGMAIPAPREFQIEFDEKTGRLTKVVAGDNAMYAKYIEAHNYAADASREHVRRLLPLAEKTGVSIALENVWNDLWVQPAIFKHFVASFQSPWVRAYFDIGNHVKYAPPEDWIRALGGLLVKCHVKDFRLNPADPKGSGSFVNIREGSVRWPAVRAALEDVGYNGFMTIEGGTLSMTEHAKRLDLIIGGR
jgi:L-ribulose-5-phosphate 3-epimerase